MKRFSITKGRSTLLLITALTLIATATALIACSQSDDSTSDGSNAVSSEAESVTKTAESTTARGSWIFSDLASVTIQGVDANSTSYNTASALASATTAYTTFSATNASAGNKFYLKDDVTYSASSGALSLTIQAFSDDAPIKYNAYSATDTKSTLTDATAGFLDGYGDMLVVDKNVQGPFTVTVRYSANSGSDKDDGRYAYIKLDGTEYIDSYGEQGIIPAAGATLTATYSGSDAVSVIIGATKYARIYDVIISDVTETITGTDTSATFNSVDYTLEAIDGENDSIAVSDDGTIKAQESFFIKTAVDNGNYLVTLTTNASSVISECITEDVTYSYKNSNGVSATKTLSYDSIHFDNGQPYLGITKDITSGTAFEVAVCDGVLDLEFVYSSSTITVSDITLQKESYSARSKPYLIAIGDSTTAQGDSTISAEASNLKNGYISWGACISNSYVDLSDSLGGFINCAESGGTVTSIYNDARIEKALLNVHPGDYVSINIGINTNHKNFSIGGQSFDSSTYLAAWDKTGPILTKYLITAVRERDGIPFITTITPQGVKSSETVASNSVYYQSATTTTSSDAYVDNFAKYSTYFGSTFDVYHGTGYVYCAGTQYSVGDTIPAATWHNSRHTNQYNVLLINIANAYDCPVVDLGVYGEKYFNENYASDSGFETVAALYHDQHHYTKALGIIFATYMQECVEKMIAGTYSYPYNDYAPNYCYLAK